MPARAAAEHRLLAEQIRLGLFAEIRLEDAGARGVDVLDLRQAEDHRLHRAVPDGRQGAGETNLRKCGQA